MVRQQDGEWGGLRIVGELVGHFVCWFGSGHGGRFRRRVLFSSQHGGGCRICEWRVIVRVIIEMELWLLLNQTRGTNVAF